MKKKVLSQKQVTAKKKGALPRLWNNEILAGSQISLADAQASILSWREKIEKDTALQDFHGFLIGTDDILGLASVMINHMIEKRTILGVRAYLGTELRKSSPFYGKPSLIFVAVEQEQPKGINPPTDLYGRDILNLENALDDSGSGIFNLTSPCPPCCQPESPLVSILSNKKKLQLKDLGKGKKPVKRTGKK